MEVSGLPLAPTQRAKLISAGYTTLSSLSSLSPPDLARDLNVSYQEAQEILKIVLQTGNSSRLGRSHPNHSIVNGAQTAWDMLHEEEILTRITTSSNDLDNILGGGISCKEVTEIGGVPGIGKTQLGIQLAVNVQIPVDHGGLGGKAIYIDTEGSFMVERVFQIAEACSEGLLQNHVFQRKDVKACPEKMHPNTFLANIFYYRICSYTEQIAVINHLEKFIEEHKDVVCSEVATSSGPVLAQSCLPSIPFAEGEEFPGVHTILEGLLHPYHQLAPVKIVIIDSVTFHFRQDFDDMALRTRVLSGMALKLMKLAKKFSLAVVLLNQVTTKYIEGSFQLSLALGDSWSHACTNRVILYWNGDERYAYIDKSPSLRSASAPYSVTGKGIRDSVSHCKRIRMM